MTASLSGVAFVGLLYANVLGRDPDGAGFAYWSDKLDTGQTSRGELTGLLFRQQ